MKYPAFKALGFVCLIAGVCAYAQSVFSGNIQGVVSDPSGAAVPAAAVTLRNLDTGVETAATTSTSGNYRFSLPPGRYTVHVETAGFRPAEEGVTLDTKPDARHQHYACSGHFDSGRDYSLRGAATRHR
ncbi:MAG TPA: carboxypeptidase-like regulatory domain-containing protein [Bryobacteraceae bacterium]|nr:carboxypeptidase-like regulatory domain-containing protein [Bryobacteraceae bacterium]